MKIVNERILSNISDFGLAIWIMEDGSFHKKRDTYCLATCCFTYKEHIIMKNWFDRKYNVDTRIVFNSHNKLYTLKFRKKDSEIIRNIIKPYIIPSMVRKIQKH